jgi:hypothetical protein
MWTSGGGKAKELVRAAFLLNQLQMHNAEQRPCMLRMVFSLIGSMQSRLPSTEAWQAMTQASAGMLTQIV